MPMKIFVCRCKGMACDANLEKKIEKLAEEHVCPILFDIITASAAPLKLLILTVSFINIIKPLSNITSCVEYESPTMILNGSETVYVKHTSYCYTEMRLEFWKNGDVKYNVKGGAATRAMVDENRLYLDHIAYAAYDLAGRADMPACIHFRGDPESEISKSRAICFCRWFKHRSEPCNEQQEERAKAMALLFHEENFHRLHLTHSSALEFFMDKMEDLWCHYRRMFATIKINYKRRKMESRGGCAERARSTLDKSISKMKGI
ncbi:unnamed protein product [Gongylonema pulchrum]|uniref:FLYWCH-type domain-containing protein n=1 Tax=Gongylonema pulchrum TaxID=637853 RepID=A0A183E6C7_9BILA|nr:unnamed protein product [Gongylonema pulchrum]